ncbi:MAG TPA: twin-arginine translocase TatA/TatE family subunit [Thermoanaerobaculia bacterium]|jgi:sec-independent protein translocase protein TatA|nr:twin-arginine translocase TatA/TatE family subunit [Thermoanaerobaculia bacterium]
MFEGLFQPMHLLLILGIALLFFGPKRLPELGKGLGTSIRDFRDAMSGQKPEDKANSQLEAPKAAAGAVGTPLPAQAAPAPPATGAPAPPAQAAPPQGPYGGIQA